MHKSGFQQLKYQNYYLMCQVIKLENITEQYYFGCDDLYLNLVLPFAACC